MGFVGLRPELLQNGDGFPYIFPYIPSLPLADLEKSLDQSWQKSETDEHRESGTRFRDQQSRGIRIHMANTHCSRIRSNYRRSAGILNIHCHVVPNRILTDTS